MMLRTLFKIYILSDGRAWGCYQERYFAKPKGIEFGVDHDYSINYDNSAGPKNIIPFYGFLSTLKVVVVNL